MGSAPRKQSKTYKVPKRPYEAARLDAELKVGHLFTSWINVGLDGWVLVVGRRMFRGQGAVGYGGVGNEKGFSGTKVDCRRKFWQEGTSKVSTRRSTGEQTTPTGDPSVDWTLHLENRNGT